MKRLLFFICTLLCANVIFAQSRFWEGNLKYEVREGTGEVIVYDCDTSATSVNIPSSVTHAWKHYSSSCDCYITDSVRTYSVTYMRDFAFAHCHSLTSVTIPNSVNNIGSNSFYCCSSLTSVTIGDSVTYIGSDAFEDCTSLTSVDIPNSVTSIGDYAFKNCSSLTSVTIGNSVTHIGERAFKDCTSLTILNFNAINCDGWSYFVYKYPFMDTPITTINIGNSVQRIPSHFAYNLDNLTSITIPNSVTSIGRNAFEGCSSLTSVTIPNSVTTISSGAFAGCSSLTSVTIPNSVTSIYGGTFANCSSLTSVTIPNSVTTIDRDAFYNCSSLTSVTIPNSVTSIGYNAFMNCSSLTSVTIPNSVTSIREGAFQNCSSLTNLNYNAINCNYNFSSGFDPHPFENCPISTINIGDSVQIIPDYFADNLDNLTSITIPNSVTDIGGGAFYGCHRLNSVISLATNPPDLYNSSFYGISTNTLYVPNGCRQVYQNSEWSYRFYCIIELGSNNSIAELDVEVNNEEWGSVEVNEGLCGTDTLRAVAEMYCSEFLRWSDGNTNNPRVVNVTSDTSFTAIFKDPVLDTTIDATIMQGETYNLNGQELSEEGVYNATVLSVAGCEINLTVNLYVIPNNYTNGETSSLSDAELEEIAFYPNPTKSLISFSKTIERIEVVDINGKILLSFSNVREINIGDLPAGSYLLRLHSNENSVLRKVVKE